MMKNRKISAALGALTLAVVLAACAGAPDAAATPASPSPAPSAEASTEPSPTPPPATPTAPTCDTIVSAGTVKLLTDAGWTFQEKEFVVGGVPLPDGLLCFWADYTVASDHGQLYGWSPISAEDATEAQSSLLAAGWTREDGDDGIYITENPQYSMGTDTEGYGMTYLFGDGWVKFADTRQSLILIEWAG